MKLSSGQKQDFQLLIHCPASGEQVMGNNLLHFSMPGAKGAWWYCPVCQSWHVLVYVDDKEEQEIHNKKINQLCLQPV